MADTLCALAASAPGHLACSAVAPAPAGKPRTARQVKLWGVAVGGALCTLAAAQCTRKGNGCQEVGMRAHLGVGPVIRPRQQHSAGPDKAAEVVYVVIRGPVLMHPLHSSASGFRCLVPVSWGSAFCRSASRTTSTGNAYTWWPNLPAPSMRSWTLLRGFQQIWSAKRRLDRALLWHTSHMMVSSCKSYVACCNLYNVMTGSTSHALPWAARGPS